MIRRSGHCHPVSLAVGIAGVCEPQCQVSLVAEQQSSTAVGIQASNRVQSTPEIRGDEVQNGPSALGVIAAADNAWGFVEQQDPFLSHHGHRRSIHADQIRFGVSLIAESCNRSVDVNATLAQEFFCLTA